MKKYVKFKYPENFIKVTHASKFTSRHGQLVWVSGVFFHFTSCLAKHSKLRRCEMWINLTLGKRSYGLREVTQYGTFYIYYKKEWHGVGVVCQNYYLIHLLLQSCEDMYIYSKWNRWVSLEFLNILYIFVGEWFVHSCFSNLPGWAGCNLSLPYYRGSSKLMCHLFYI